MNKFFSEFDSILVLDTETSGLNFKDDRIIELAVIRYVPCESGGKIDFEMDDFIKLPAGRVLDEKIIELTGITDKMLEEEGIMDCECAEKFASVFTEKPLIVAYNAQFDLNYLFYFLHRAGKADVLKRAKMLDALTVYKDRHEYPHRLENAIEIYNLQDKVVNSHRAIDDTKALLEVLFEMAKEKDDLDKYINLFGYNPKYGVSGAKIASVKYLPQYYRHEKLLYQIDKLN